MALASVFQTDFSAGIHRGRKAPENSVYDAVNALINDEGLLFRRGGSEYKSNTNAGQTLLGVADVHVVGGQRTIFTSGTSSDKSWVLDSDDATPIDLTTSTGAAWRPMARGAAAGGLVFFPNRSGAASQILLYGGSREVGYATGTVSVTNGSATVTGAGTTWTGNVDPGSILILDGVSAFLGVVKTVNSNTSITLVSPWTGSTSAGAAYFLLPFAVTNPSTAYFTSSMELYVATVGSTPRLLVAGGQRIYVSDRGEPLSFPTDSYLELPSDATITGADAFQNAGLAFTTRGVWALLSLDFDSVDADGNIQWQQEQISKDVILWGDPGIAAWQGALLVPAVDDVYILGLGGPLGTVTGDSENEKVRREYRSYVKAGYQPGTATVHRGHYFLPVVNGTTLVDTLVCRLDRGAAWTRWSGHAASVSYAQRVGSSTRSPKLFAVASQRVLDLTDTLDPATANAAEADATVHDCTITTRDYPTGANQHGFVSRARLRYECVDGGSPDPAVALAYTSDQDAGSFSTLTDKGLQNGGTGGAASDGSKYNWWIVGKRRERIRFRVTVSGACASFVLRSIELLLRPTGRQ